MSETETPPVGSVAWCDLTVEDAPALRDFYERVVGWSADPVSMGEYEDYNMASPGSGAPVAGICHARGTNAGLPSQWILYVTVADLDASLDRCREGGGEVLAPPRSAGGGRYAVIRDPAGAVLAVWQTD